ncbi:Procollagen-lysine,2-oxoglutarate 5-dioxygenase 1 [Seminavis robusta]|uniref:Procollagen-lysine,2-oxoglutarate 5-dioxygenase 1 n=1 Tax=Seminavis robusta TaxID=568900 RepID=A0A9N8F0R3_9STRA|nr:Procollagen-lysine,2-oxoglutarate 5-dioxygenase 1 [Seminavis robusta]|eukprot:Sro2652_g333690.1 Procollagen-lysine,2-oxoglutarate 5-dioxygenase 1 (478) ;mRNA; f:970-2750
MAVPIDTYMEANVLPNYEAKCMVLSVVVIVTAVFWVVIFPYVASRLLMEPEEVDTSKKKDTPSTDTATTSSTPSTKAKPSNGMKRRGKSNKKSTTDANKKTTQKDPSQAKDETPPPEPPSVPLPILAVASLGCMVSLFYEVMTMSPYNTFVARGVFQVPILTALECEQLINISMAAAKINQDMALQEQQRAEIAGESLNRSMESLLWEPKGWQKLRHGNYPTTDLNVITDPFQKKDLDWLQEKLDARLAPTLSRIYGLPESAIRANDMFVVRYDADFRAKLENHTDDSDISINVLLTDDFEGGGTRFWKLNHEGMQTTKGTRMIFVGFLGVDRIDPFAKDDNRKPKLNLWASWLSLPWVSTKFKEAYSSMIHRKEHGGVKYGNNKYVEALFLDLANVFQIVGDFFAVHHVKNLVAPENADRFINNLDEAYRERQQKEVDDTAKATWFAGQQVDLDLDGTITAEWSTRRASKNRFMEL